jgi:ureidoglycolate hydrolase
VIPSQQGIGLVQSLFTADQKNNISISKTHVIMHSKVIDQMEKHYIQTTTGIQPVTKGSIVI